MISKDRLSVNKSILEESESISQNTQVITDVAERRVVSSLTAKEHNMGSRQNELNLIQELRKYRRSDEIHFYLAFHERQSQSKLAPN